jgi:NAD(P)-dependent dehydrogenase (short-subunit alcohol dehydrogenase family)
MVMTANKVALVIGAGDALGSAIARRFARQGYLAVLVRRNSEKLEPLVAQIKAQGGEAVGLACDARKEDQMTALFEKVEQDLGPIEVCVFNIGANVRFSILETTARVYFKVWEMAAFSGFLAGREAARHMVSRARGTILFTGATASLRGKEGFSAFAGAKAALRSLAQSMARELGPKGIHVAHILIDGPMDTEWIAANFPEAHARKATDGILNPDHVAENYWQIHCQPRDAWTHELDLRPWSENW